MIDREIAVRCGSVGRGTRHAIVPVERASRISDRTDNALEQIDRRLHRLPRIVICPGDLSRRPRSMRRDRPRRVIDEWRRMSHRCHRT